MKLWMDKLKKEKICIFLKDKITQPPPGSNLNTETFVMCLQTPYQVDAFQRLGDWFIGIDATDTVVYPRLRVIRTNWA